MISFQLALQIQIFKLKTNRACSIYNLEIMLKKLIENLVRLIKKEADMDRTAIAFKILLMISHLFQRMEIIS